MQECEICGTPFKWGEFFRANWFYSVISCRKCGKAYHITFSSRFIMTVLTIVPMMIFIWNSPFGSTFMSIGFGLMIAFLGSIPTPYLVRYRPETSK
ncbi:TIGR04104 family putative zinc finger protein [Halobacillus sp. BBL2006]|uniref:TIGR04104 family putative zinc finger protein n=1 Tax=Halobacillus sp. BBL2006 TaxID=1543706 RepID=UPI000542F754|nr:hypothetical protein LD39_00300 [Halobacillus sp. BBL2006]